MNTDKSILVPDFGDFEKVEIIEIAVSEGDIVTKEDTLLTLESDKASIDIPSPYSGTIKKLTLKIGDRVSPGDHMLTMITKNADHDDHKPITELTENASATPTHTETKPQQHHTTNMSIKHGDMHCQILVLGGGPGGYTAAFRAADLGQQTILVERYQTLGGVCLNVGCIPSKSLLHIAKVISEINELKHHGLNFGTADLNANSIRQYATKVINKLTTGLKAMAKKRKVDVLHGIGTFVSSNMMAVEGVDGIVNVSFEYAIIAAGSQPKMIDDFPTDQRIMNSTDALLLETIPQKLLVIGGGIIGLEMATVYQALGSKITVVEMLGELVSGCDKDIVLPLKKHLQQHYQNIYLSTAVTAIKTDKKHLTVSFEGAQAPKSDNFDAILLSIGRQPNGAHIGAENAGVAITEQGFIPVDDQQRTNQPNIFAIGDIVGQPMLAHKATHEGKLAAEVIAGLKHGFDNRIIPSVAYTDPELAWAGVTEDQAKEQGIEYDKGVFPWAASGRSLSIGRNEGLTKLLFDKQSNRIIGAAIVGPNASELIAECVLAIEMGADAEDIGLTIHPHPTLSETVGLSAEAYIGTITDLYMPKK